VKTLWIWLALVRSGSASSTRTRTSGRSSRPSRPKPGAARRPPWTCACAGWPKKCCALEYAKAR